MQNLLVLIGSEAIEVKYIGIFCLNRLIDRFLNMITSDFYQNTPFFSAVIAAMVGEPNALVQLEFANCIGVIAKT